MLEEPDFVAGMLEFVNVGPDFGLPRLVVGGRLSATGTARVEGDGRPQRGGRGGRAGQFEEDATHVFDLAVGAENVLVTQEVSKAELAGLGFGFFAGEERSVF